jgi:hypothetical protein
LGSVERFANLILLLALAGCQTAKAPEQRATPVKSQQEARPAVETVPPQTVTPQSIVNDMFPNAPEKTQSVDCFRSLTPEMSIYLVVQKCGRPDEEVGSGVAIFLYHLRDGSTVAIRAVYLPKIDGVIYTDPSGKSSSILSRR